MRGIAGLRPSSWPPGAEPAVHGTAGDDQFCFPGCEQGGYMGQTLFEDV